MKIDEKMRELVKAAPKAKIMKYQAFVSRAERDEVFKSMKANGFKLINDNEFLMRFAKFNKAMNMYQVTVCDYMD